MFPTISLGSWHIRTYGALAGLALFVASMYGFHRLLRLGLSAGGIIRGGMLTILGGLAGAFLVAYLPGLPHLIRTGTLERTENLRITWGLVGGISVAAIHCRKHKIPLGRAFDLGGLACPLGQAIARLGCFAAGCCAGKATTSWLGMYLPDIHGTWMVRYPTQLMSAAANLLIFITLLAVERYGKRRQDKRGSQSWPFDGFIFLLYVELFSLKRLVVAFLREDAVPLLGPLNWIHLHAVISLILATALILWNLYAGPRSTLSRQREEREENEPIVTIT